MADREFSGFNDDRPAGVDTIIAFGDLRYQKTVRFYYVSVRGPDGFVVFTPVDVRRGIG